MLKALREGVATVCVLARQVGATLDVVDVGVGDPTGDLATKAALDPARFRACVQAGRDAVAGLDADLLVLGEMGIGSTTAAAAVTAILLDRPPQASTGQGTGVDDAGLARKLAAVEAARRGSRPARRRWRCCARPAGPSWPPWPGPPWRPGCGASPWSSTGSSSPPPWPRWSCCAAPWPTPWPGALRRARPPGPAGASRQTAPARPGHAPGRGQRRPGRRAPAAPGHRRRHRGGNLHRLGPGGRPPGPVGEPRPGCGQPCALVPAVGYPPGRGPATRWAGFPPRPGGWGSAATRWAEVPPRRARWVGSGVAPNDCEGRAVNGFLGAVSF